MPYPMAPMLTLAEFLHRVQQEYGVEVKTTEHTPVGLKGEAPIRYMKREGRPIVILPDIDDADRLTPTTLSNFCRLLKIPATEFGLKLGPVRKR